MTVKVRADGARRSRKGRGRAALMALSGVLAVTAVAACGGHDGGSPRGGTTGAQGDFRQAPQSDGPLTVWVDATRLAAAKLYQKTHPSAKLNIVSYDGDADGSHYLQTKVSLFNRTRKGWPDVVFSTQNNETSWAVQAGFTAPLNKGLIAQSALSGWAHGAGDPCTVNGTLYCLRNDLARTGLWYNASLMRKPGYQVPPTREHYEALGKRAPTERRGYIARPDGGNLTPQLHLWRSQWG